MRRVALLIVLVVVVAAAAAAALIDWRFWYRWYTLPEDPGEWPASYYQPTVTVRGDPGEFFPSAARGERTIDGEALEAAATWAEEHNTAALLVLHKGVVQLERYWRDIGPDSLFTGRAMTRSLIPPLVASALEEGAIKSLDDGVGDYVPEWRDDPRGRITVRQLLGNLSGLENDLLANDPDPFNKNTQLSLSGDFYGAALDFELANTPGAIFRAGKRQRAAARHGAGGRDRRILRKLPGQPPVGTAR